MRMRPPHPKHSILVFLLALWIAACESDSPPTAPVPGDRVVQSEPGPSGGNGSQGGDGRQEPGPPSPNEDEPPAGGDDGSGPSEEQPEPEPEPGNEPPAPEAPSDPPAAPDSVETSPPDSTGDDDLLAALNEEPERELAELISLIPQMLDLYADLLTTWTLSLLQDTGELLACTPLTYAFDAEIIGPAGGTLNVRNHTLSIPAGALDRPVVIVAQSVPSLNVEIALTPHGLSFTKPVALTLSYEQCGSGLLGGGLLGDQTTYRIVHIDENGDLHDVPSTDDKLRRRVTGSLDHFSRYAIAR